MPVQRRIDVVSVNPDIIFVLAIEYTQITWHWCATMPDTCILCDYTRLNTFDSYPIPLDDYRLHKHKIN